MTIQSLEVFFIVTYLPNQNRTVLFPLRILT
jgi:hypothetical protein